MRCCDLIEMSRSKIITLPQSRKEAILSCLLTGNRSFINTRDGSRKLNGPLEERQWKVAQLDAKICGNENQ